QIDHTIACAGQLEAHLAEGFGLLECQRHALLRQTGAARRQNERCASDRSDSGQPLHDPLAASRSAAGASTSSSTGMSILSGRRRGSASTSSRPGRCGGTATFENTTPWGAGGWENGALE